MESSLPSSGYESRNSSNTSAQLRSMATATVRYHDNHGYQTTVRPRGSTLHQHHYYTYDRKSMETRGQVVGGHGDRWRQTDLDPVKVSSGAPSNGGGNPESRWWWCLLFFACFVVVFFFCSHWL